MPQSEDRKGHGDGWVCALIAHRGKDKATQHVRKEVSSGLWKWLCQTNHTSSPLIQWYFPFKSQPASLDVCLIIEQGKTRAEACHCKVSLFDWSKIKIWAEVKPKNTRDHQQALHDNPIVSAAHSTSAPQSWQHALIQHCLCGTHAASHGTLEPNSALRQIFMLA